MQKYIYFRDKGCQAAKDIILSALEMAKDVEISKKNCSNNVLFFTADSQKAQPIIDIYAKACTLMGCEFHVTDNISLINEHSIVLADENFFPTVENLEADNLLIAQALQHDSQSANAFAMFTTMVYTALRTNKPLYELNFSWMGDAGAEQNSFASSLINSTICLQHSLAFAFADNPAQGDICAPPRSILDFAMTAGSKIFLTYDPAFIDESADVLYITPWTYKDQGDIKPSHPFTYETISNNFNNNTHIISFIPEVSSSEIDEELFAKAALYTRVALLSYFGKE